ncbi:DAK2 domain-containing protein [Proteiniborus sp. MB09-C3]|uniref:DAK2 domain-containing protein n=1 Tax=Proteiniborus sp. MB09-C3 TaxID=3050072 RepID=UPI002555360D|nr:DAK2 domain-containing protein [Proteiniborus sp. MB09-C3]WIV13945.1 DAK2 domain-containing protein [Proteiniborus sp. MB09-C3]
MLKKLFFGAANCLEKNKEAINALNVFPVPDGDTGTNMSLTMQSAIKQIRTLETDDIDKIVTAASNGSLMGARGNSGVILSQLFRGFAKGLKDTDKIDTSAIATALKLGSDTAYKAVMKPIEGTILTVARESAEMAINISKQETDMVEFLRTVIKHGEDALARTPEMLPVLKQAGVVDAGGKGLITIFIGALEALTGKEETLVDDVIAKDDTANSFIEADGDITFGYCTEFIINNSKVDYEVFRDEIVDFGDSMLVVGGDNIIKVHIHTNEPGGVLQKALQYGELIDIKIDNMRYQHRNNLIDDTATTAAMENTVQKESKKYSFITVSMGEGLSNVFHDLNADYVIAGGQTMNPSTEDILNAIDKVNGENIIVLPNNGNIILAATQAKELSNKKVEVLPTKTIPQGIAALVTFDEELSMEENVENMKDTIASVKTGQVTFSVRDTIMEEKEIKKDDIMGIYDGKIEVIGNNVHEVAFSLVKSMVNDDNGLVTIFYGNNLSEQDATDLANRIEEEFEDLDIEVVFGGQPLYYYLISVE